MTRTRSLLLLDDGERRGAVLAHGALLAVDGHVAHLDVSAGKVKSHAHRDGANVELTRSERSDGRCVRLRHTEITSKPFTGVMGPRETRSKHR